MASNQQSSRANDDAILQAIFDPEAPVGAFEVNEERQNGSTEPQEELSEEVLRAKELEKEAVRAANRDELGDALELLNRAVSEAPEYASLYNNRAQVYRLQSQVEQALVDLNTAIALSRGKGMVAELAYAQRGQIWRLKGEDEKARSDFEAAASLGNRFAHHQAVRLNPLAALCNTMLSEVTGKLKRGEM